MQKNMKKRIFFGVLVVTILLALGCVTTSAEDTYTQVLPDEYGQLSDALPDDITDLLPEGLFSTDPNQSLTATETLTTPDYLFRTVLSMVGLYMGDVLQLLLVLLGLLLLAALLRRLQNATGKVHEGFSFCVRLCMYTGMITGATDMLTWVKTYLERLGTFMNGMIPVMGVLYAMGGNIGQATVNQEMLLILLGVCQYMATTLTPALCGICLAFALMEAFGGKTHIQLAPLSGLCKKWYTSLLGFLMFLLTTALSVQSLLISKADTLSMRGVKYAVGNMLPVVGGAVSGTLGSVAAGVSLLRGIAGVSGVILLALLLLPTLVQLLLYHACYRFTSTIAGMLSCDDESKLLGEIGSLYGYMAAAVSICALAFIIAMAIFAQGTAAISPT